MLRLCAGLVLLAGLGLACWAWNADEAAPEDGTTYVLENGESFAVSPWDSRSTVRNLELYGGKSAVLMTQLRQWLAGFWRGRTLAAALLLAGVLGAAGCLWVAEGAGAAPPGEGRPKA